MNKMKIIGLAQTEFLGVFQTHFTIWHSEKQIRRITMNFNYYIQHICFDFVAVFSAYDNKEIKHARKPNKSHLHARVFIPFQLSNEERESI